VIQHARTGLLVPDGDVDNFAQQIILLLNDKTLCHSLGESARTAVGQDFNRNRWISELNDLVESAARNR
jgi:glycosyltransferase involved in cell wall biosynthesis